MSKQSNQLKQNGSSSYQTSKESVSNLIKGVQINSNSKYLTSDKVKKKLEFQIDKKFNDKAINDKLNNSSQISNLLRTSSQKVGFINDSPLKRTLREPSPTFQTNEVLKPQLENTKDLRDQYQSSYSSLYQTALSSEIKQNSKPQIHPDGFGKRISFNKQTESKLNLSNLRNKSTLPLGNESILSQQDRFYSKVINQSQSNQTQKQAKPPMSQRMIISNRRNKSSVENILNSSAQLNKKDTQQSEKNVIHSHAQKKHHQRPQTSLISPKQNLGGIFNQSLDISRSSKNKLIDQTSKSISNTPQQAKQHQSQYASQSLKYANEFDDEIGAKSFVDSLTIDYKKTLNDYKYKLTEEVRRQAISNQFSQMNTLRESKLKLEGKEETSFVECLGADPFKVVHQQKNRARSKNQDLIHKQLMNTTCKREVEKQKLLQRNEDFVATFTNDPFMQAYQSKQTGLSHSELSTQYNTNSTSNKSDGRKEMQLANYLKSQINLKQEEMMKQKKTQLVEEQAYLSLLKKKETREKAKQLEKLKYAKQETKDSLKRSEQERERFELQKKIQQTKERDQIRAAPIKQQHKNDILTKYMEQNIMSARQQPNPMKLMKFLNP